MLRFIDLETPALQENDELTRLPAGESGPAQGPYTPVRNDGSGYMPDGREPGVPTPMPERVELPETDYGDQAGLRPLPINRMRQQAGRQMNRQTQRRIRGVTERGVDRIPTQPGTAEKVIQKHQKMNEVVDNWDPIEAEWQEWTNRNRTNKRSKPSFPSTQQLDGWFQKALKDAADLRRKGFNETADHYGLNAKEYKAAEAKEQQLKLDTRLTEFMMLDTGRWASLKDALFSALDGKLAAMRKNTGEGTIDDINMTNLPAQLQYGIGREVGNDLLAEWRSSRSRPAMGPVDAMELVQPIAPLDEPMYEAFPGV